MRVLEIQDENRKNPPSPAPAVQVQTEPLLEIQEPVKIETELPKEELAVSETLAERKVEITPSDQKVEGHQSDLIHPVQVEPKSETKMPEINDAVDVNLSG